MTEEGSLRVTKMFMKKPGNAKMRKRKNAADISRVARRVFAVVLSPFVVVSGVQVLRVWTFLRRRVRAFLRFAVRESVPQRLAVAAVVATDRRLDDAFAIT